MIKFPPCFSCKLYDSNNFCCPAFPDGITDDILKKKIKEGKKAQCSNNIFFVPMSKNDANSK